MKLVKIPNLLYLTWFHFVLFFSPVKSNYRDISLTKCIQLVKSNRTVVKSNKSNSEYEIFLM